MPRLLVIRRPINLVLHAHPLEIRIQLYNIPHFPRTGLRAPARVRPGAPVRHQLRPQPLEVRVVVPEEEVVRAAFGPPPPVEGHHFEVARETHEVVAAPRRHRRRVSWMEVGRSFAESFSHLSFA